ncbi:MAG: hypothetical protein ACLS3V_01100 [Streptococcus sp.]
MLRRHNHTNLGAQTAQYKSAKSSGNHSWFANAQAGQQAAFATVNPSTRSNVQFINQIVGSSQPSAFGTTFKNY